MLFVELMVYHNVAMDSVVQNIENGHIHSAMQQIIEFSENSGVTGDGVWEYIMTKLADDENVLSNIVQAGGVVGDDLYACAVRDIQEILNAIVLKTNIKYCPSGNAQPFYDEYTKSIKSFVKGFTAKELLDSLIQHYSNLGCGIFSKYIAFRYDENGLCGVRNIDNVTFDDLVGLEYQKKILKENTHAFVRGKRANNMLLFGDRGSGKSSSVKALLNEFSKYGLRMIEVPKHTIRSIPTLVQQLAQKPHKYIIFLDDLSFESHETDYRALKVAMEGQLQASPQNVLICATSNRRHLIRENWSDREGGEVHVNDNLQETLSLSERFGISLVFSSPASQAEYLKIVAQLLHAKGFESTPEIEKKAIVWYMNYGSRSARCANQFVSSYVANFSQVEQLQK